VRENTHKKRNSGEIKKSVRIGTRKLQMFHRNKTTNKNEWIDEAHTAHR